MLGRNIFAAFRIGIALFLIVCFAVMPVVWPTGISVCAISNVLGVMCPTCGGTRAFASVMHLDFIGAFDYNPVITLLFIPIFLLLLVNDVFCLIQRIRGRRQSQSWVEYVLFGEMGRSIMGGDR